MNRRILPACLAALMVLLFAAALLFQPDTQRPAGVLR